MKHWQGRKIAITGGAGFIGSHLTERLLGLGAEVTIIDNFLFGSKIEHIRSHPALSVIEGDIRDADAVSRAVEAKDIVFHLAACVGVEETQQMPHEVLDIEINGTKRVLDAVVASSVSRFIFGSSSEVYGDSAEPMKEGGSCSPKSTYAVAKLVGEEYCKAYHQRYGLEYTCLRYFNVYGPRQDERFVLPRFVSQVLSGKPLTIYGDGSQTRDFTHIDDVIGATLVAAEAKQACCQTINVGTGIMTTINDAAYLVAAMMNGSTPAQTRYIEYGGSRPREIEVFYRAADTSLARRLLQYEPRVTLKAGLKNYVDHRKGDKT